MEQLLTEVHTALGQDIEISDLRNPQTFVDMPTHDAIPVEDITYRKLTSTLIPHPRIPDMFLLRFLTFDNCVAYQPCSKDIDLLGVFNPLRIVEGNVDPIFRAARDWSCIIQALPGLPKDYEVADNLFNRYDIFATAPDPDWFMRPLPRLERPSKSTDHVVGINKDLREHWGRRNAGEDVSQCSPISSLVLESEQDNAEPRNVAASRNIIDRFFGQSRMIETNDDGQLVLFDPAPGGWVSSQWQPLSPTSRKTALSQLNPLADEFVPSAYDERQDDDEDTEDLFECISDSCSTCISSYDDASV
ncbi:hypothetical protein FSARC_4050 [Fusarium sarcochroum]|uniref:Uncharacterized protein n=1 Tax=Fusarium sarcochroum TaxID=1208366 RepID=A0A8H4U2P6_9HYPO|nr:hypothetical protein FSARC_4050 [Fusarium sarcochroum]